MRTILIAALLTGGCSGGGSMGESTPPLVRLVVDADRDGKADPASTADSTRAAGAVAIFLANVDDDDGDQKVDGDDEQVNGEADAEDLARIRVVAWPEAPAMATGKIALQPAAGVRLFRRHVDGSFVPFHPDTELLDEAALREGVELGIEGRDFPSPTWDGAVAVSLTVTAADGKVLGSDQAAMRCAPLLLQSNIEPTERVYIAQVGDLDSRAFILDVTRGLSGTGVPVDQIDSLDDRYVDEFGFPDQWTQDHFELGYTAMPGKAIHVVLRTPVPDRYAADFAEDELLGPDFGFVWKHSDPYNRGDEESSLDSFGNLDMVPPYENGASRYPLGRVLFGGVPDRHVDDALRGFLSAQAVQKPLEIDTAWLAVGHVDEAVMFVKASTPRGFALLVASPAKARALLQGLVDQDAKNADLVLFAGRLVFDADYNEVPANITIGALLADADRMAANQVAQGKLSALRDQLQKEIGLADNEVIEVPVIFEEVPVLPNLSEYTALTPNLVNLLHVDGRALPPKSHGPLVNGTDALDGAIKALGAPIGLTVTPAEDWNLYHRLEGEVHCGTNPLREIPKTPWWEVTP